MFADAPTEMPHCKAGASGAGGAAAGAGLTSSTAGAGSTRLRTGSTTNATVTATDCISSVQSAHAPQGVVMAPPCDEWTSASMQSGARVGQVGRTGPEWTSYSGTTCDQTAHLLCFEQ